MPCMLHAIGHYARNVAHALKPCHHVVSTDVPMTGTARKDTALLSSSVTVLLIVLCLDLHSET